MIRLNLTLPDAPPEDWLGLADYLRGAEAAARDGRTGCFDPAEVRELFLENENAKLLARMVVSAIVAQAREAMQQGRSSIGPIVEIETEDVDRLTVLGRFLSARIRWIESNYRELGLEPLEPRRVELRRQMRDVFLEENWSAVVADVTHP